AWRYSVVVWRWSWRTASASRAPRTSRATLVSNPRISPDEAAPEPLGVRPAELLGQGRRELAPRSDPELPVAAREVDLHGLERHVERLRDLLVRVPRGGEIRHAPLARRERTRTGPLGRARPCARGVELRADALLEPVGAAAVGEVERAAERVARLGRPPLESQRGAERRVRERQLVAGRRALEQLHRLAQPFDPPLRIDAGEHAQRAAHDAGGGEAAGHLGLLSRQPHGLFHPPESGEGERAQ